MSKRRDYGTGSLYVRATGAGVESWYGRWWSNGVQIQRKVAPKSGPGGLTRRAAEKALRELIGQVRVTEKVAEVLTIKELGARYMQALEKRGRKKATTTAVELALRVHLEPYFGQRGVASIKPADVDDLIAVMEKRGLSPKSIRNYIGTLSALFNFARSRRQPWVRANPCENVELPGVQEATEIKFLDVDEVESLVAAVTSGPYEAIDRALYLTAAMTGLRQGELIALRWRDVDWSAGRVRVRQNYVLGEFGTPKSKRSTRSVPMADRVAGELERLFKARYGDDAAEHADELVFGTPGSGRPLQRARTLVRFRAALKAAGLDESRRFHDLRHTFGTRIAAAGVPMRTLQEWMGHRDIGTTQIYADYAPSAREAAMVEAAFASQGHNPGHIVRAPEST